LETREIQQPAPPTLRVSFPGGKRVDAEWGSRVIRTDQSVAHGGNGTAPEPFDLFLASLATCAGFYVLSFCQTRGIPTEGIELVQHHHFDEHTHRLARVELTLRLPPAFPERYRPAIVEAAAQCKVKKVLMDPPEVVVTARVETIDDRSSHQTRGPMVPPAVIAQ
jgi:ribosomal protein S12 methylthiotransferase accessory factor